MKRAHGPELVSIKYKGHRIEGPSEMLGMYHYHGPQASGGTWSVEQAKRVIRRRLLQPTCPHTKERYGGRIGGTMRFMIYCDRCDKLLRREEAPPMADEEVAK